MSKIINTSVDNCISCPHCFECRDGHTPDTYLFSFQCTVANKRIGGNKEVTEDTPIPKWCPLPDGESMQYFVVKEELAEVDDNTAIPCKTITAYKIGQETWLLGSWEKADAVLVNNINHLNDREPKVVIIFGRIISEGEVDLDRGNTHPSRRR